MPSYDLGNQLTGPRATFVVNGIELAWSTSVDFNQSYAHEPCRVIGNFEVVEHVPVAYDATLSCGKFYLVKENLTSLGIQPELGPSAQQHLLNTLRKGEMTASLEDQNTGSLQATVFGVKLSGNGWGISASQLVMNNVGFVCKRVKEGAQA